MRAFAGFALNRVLVACAFVLIVSSSAFVLVRLAPGDATSQLALTGADQATIDAARARLQLDQPLLIHFGAWASGIIRFDLGQSSRFGRPVRELVVRGLVNTAELAGLALLLAVGFGIPLGVFTGTHPRSALSHAIGIVSVALVSCPPIIATLALLFVAVLTGWLSVAPGSVALPTLAMALPLAAMLERLQSQATAQAFHSIGILAAAARGVPERRLIWVHAARQALQPVLGVFGITIATLFSGSIAVETLTAWPGLGRLMLEGLVGRDLFLVAGCALAGAALIAVGNLIGDLLRGAADPRVRQSA